MRVIRAEAMGMCFGVRDAIALTEIIENPVDITIYGELVHNELVNGRLAQRGFASHTELGRTVPSTSAVMITAHGVSAREKETLKQAGKAIIDTTCPLVKRAHDTALKAQSDGWHVVIAGKRGHVEVIGLAGDLDNPEILERPEHAAAMSYERIAIVCQTTLQPAMAEAILVAIKAANPLSEVRLLDTICRPTKERQLAMELLVQQCDAVVVVGGSRSNNTLQLVRRAEVAGKPVAHVNAAEDVDLQWAAQYSTIGLTAGTSTPDDVINAVEARLLGADAAASPRDSPAPRLLGGFVPSSKWIEWFQWNAENQADLPWKEEQDLPPNELAAVAASLQEFQRGESSEGRSFLSRGFRHAVESGDSDYYEALRLFIAEENRHGAYLGSFLIAHHVPLLHATPADNIFRFLRHIGGLEGAIRVLLTAEVIACTYYRAMAAATSSPVLKAICRQVLHDEYKHLRFQKERLELIGINRPNWIKHLGTWLQSIMLMAAILAIWPRHRVAINAGGYTLTSFWRETFEVYYRQITGKKKTSSAGLLQLLPREVANDKL